MFQIDRLKCEVQRIKRECAKTDDEAIRRACEKLPENQRLGVQACLDASKVKKNGIRYTNQWIYECLLLRIKSRKTYNHLRKHNIMCLPCCETLNRYLKLIKGTYGFNDNTFSILKLKTENMSLSDVHGKLLFIKYYDKNTIY